MPLYNNYPHANLTRTSMTNLITNGDFSNGTTYWVPQGGTVAIVNGQLEFTEDTNYSEHFVQQSISTIPVAGHKYYLEGFCTPSIFIWYNLKSDGNYETGSAAGAGDILTITSVNASPIFLLRGYGIGGVYTGTGAKYYYDNISMYDLTADFGAGKEPTVTQMNAWLLHYDPTNSWFDGTASVATNYVDGILTHDDWETFNNKAPAGLAGTKVYYVSDTSGGTVNRKLTFINGILSAEV